ncbi:MAG: AAA family ATPase [Oleiphilaceae bacterium]|nr:AAA family ATPase [Oleiphilaceae bacterium]
MNFTSTRSLEPLNEILGQDRAREAVRFALAMPHGGYNLYAVGRNGLGKRTMMLRYLRTHVESGRRVSDWCYVANYQEPRNPCVLELPAGLAQTLKQDMDRLAGKLVKVIPQAFDNDTYEERAETLKQDYARRQEKALDKVAAAAKREGVDLSMTTPGGYRLMAMNGDKPHSAESFEALPEKEREAFETAIEGLEKQLRKTLRRIADWEQTHAEKQQALSEETVSGVTGHLIQAMVDQYRAYPAVVDHLQAMEKDIVENLDIFLEDNEDQAAFAYASLDRKIPRRYQVNVLVSREDETVPVVVEENPTYHNLFGYVENVTYKGTVFTDFSLIRPGSLHRANGGYLLMDADKVLEQHYLWDALKRAMRGGDIRINSLERELTLSGTISLEPGPIPLDVKIVLFGDRETWMLLQDYDPEFSELFRVTADFENEMDRTPQSQQLYAQFIASLCHEKQLLPCDRKAVARVIEFSARLAEHQDRLSLHAADITNLLRESDYWARQASSRRIEAVHINQALASAEYRSSRIRDELYRGFSDGSLLLSVDGQATGQVNGLSVLATGGFEFGLPNRISATCQYGDGEVVHIERDVKLSGSIHSKGVMILSAWLAARFAQRAPIPLTATLTFEQSYAEIDGDSASLAELCALVSALSGLPARQDLAVTGSVNQFGQVQPVGGINEKVEGFFDACQRLGARDTQGVILPASNVQNLMLDQRVVDAARAGRLHLYPVTTVEEAVTLLLGRAAGTSDEKGRYPRNSVYGRITRYLDDLRREQHGERSD